MERDRLGFRLCFAVLFVLAMLSLLGVAHADTITINPTGPVYTIGRNLTWGTTGPTGTENTYVFAPLSPNENICVSIFNNASGVTQNISYSPQVTPDSSAGGTLARYIAIGQSGADMNVAGIPNNTMATSWSRISGAALVALTFHYLGVITVPTADIFLTQVTSGGGCAGTNNSVLSQQGGSMFAANSITAIALPSNPTSTASFSQPITDLMTNTPAEFGVSCPDTFGNSPNPCTPAVITYPALFNLNDGTWKRNRGSGRIGATDVNEAVFTYRNITTNASTVLASAVKAIPGVLHNVVVNTKGSASTAQIFDNTTCTGTKIATIDTATQLGTFTYDALVTTGICVLTAGTTAADITVNFTAN